jgi:hypothetical protein
MQDFVTTGFNLTFFDLQEDATQSTTGVVGEEIAIEVPTIDPTVGQLSGPGGPVAVGINTGPGGPVAIGGTNAGPSSGGY